MVLNKDCSIVFFSEILRTDQKWQQTFRRIEKLLQKHQVNYKLLGNTRDIWCRDYMPIQVEKDKFIQFRYEPSYLKEDLKHQSNPEDVLQANGFRAEFSKINLDGGNVVSWTDKVILTNRVFKENPTMSSTELIRSLECLFDAQVFSVPDIVNDMTGHVDGHLRFIDSNTLLVNELKDEYTYWRDGFIKMTKLGDFDYVEMPWFEDKSSNYSAIGVYTNYLEIADLILFPVFETKGNKDEQALRVIESVFPNRKIEPINVNDIGIHGGLLNCVSWTIQT